MINLDYDEILNEISDMEEEEFIEFQRYHDEAVSAFITASYEVVREVRENVEELSESGGDAFVLGRLSALIMDSESAQDYAERVRNFHEDSEYDESIERTVEEVFSGFFSEGDLKYDLE